MPRVKVIELADGVAEFELSITQILGLSFQGRYKQNVSVQFYGPFKDRYSMANVGSAMFRALASRIDGMALHSYITGSAFDEDLRDFAYLNTGAPVGIFLGAPYHIDECFYQHPFKIGGFVCETDRISQHWVKACNRLDLVFVPSNWCRDAFKNSGVSVPVMVVPHGLEAEYRPYRQKKRSKPFVFYNTFRSSSFGQRKGAEELIRCFLRAFEGRKDVVLRLRTDDSSQTDGYRELYDFGESIEIEPISELSTMDFAKIYSDVHCTVHPSKGEGFGLIPFQSIACETPVIAPHATGMADYLTSENSIELRTSGRTGGIAEGNQCGTYYSIDEDHLVHCLRHVFNNWEAEYGKVQAIADDFRQKHSWDSATCELGSVIQQVLDGGYSESRREELAVRFG